MSYRLALSLLAFLSSFALAAADEKPEHLNYSENFGSTDEEFQRSWRDYTDIVDRKDIRGVHVFSRYFFNADGRRLQITGLSAKGACGINTCPIRIFTELGTLVTEFSGCDAFEAHEVSADQRSIVTCGVAHDVLQNGPRGSLAYRDVRRFTHNGSIVAAYFYKNGNIEIFYDTPKPGSPATGETLFRGRIDSDKKVSGVAYTFKAGCPAAPYEVHGGFDKREDLVLMGNSPQRSDCTVVGYSSTSPNTHLRFTDAGLDGD
jgi:hypothetical protein